MAKLGHYDYHPAYRGDAYWVAQDEKFGRDRNQVPTEEMEIGRGGPWFTGGDPITLFDQGGNPVGAVFEALTDDMFGAGLDESMLDQVSFDRVRGIFGSNGFKVSVLQSDQTDLRTFLSELFECGDMFLKRKGSTIALGHWAQGDIDTAALPIIGSDDLTSEPRLKSSGYDDCYTEVNVVFADRDHYFHDAVATYRNPGLQQILGEFRSITLDRKKFITDAALAQQYATQWAQKFARPGMSGELDVKLEAVEAIEDTAGGESIVGLLIKTDSASLGFEFVFRVVECEYPGDEGPFFCTLSVELERSIWPIIYIQPGPDKLGNFIVDVPNIVNHRIVELPAALKDSSALEIAVLAQRPGKSIVGFHVWDSLDNIAYAEEPLPCSFAAYSLLTIAYPDTTPDDDTVGMTVKFFGVDLIGSLTRAEKLGKSMLCFVDGEIMSIGARAALGGGVYRFSTLRALYGTTKATHAVNAKAYFIAADHLVRIANKNFVIGDSVWFKLQPFDARQDFDLADVTPFAYLFGGGKVTPGAPTEFVVTPGVQSVGLSWIKTTINPATVTKTQIMRGPTSNFDFAGVRNEVDAETNSYVDTGGTIEAGWFYWVRHITEADEQIVLGPPVGPLFSEPIAPVGKQCATPLIAVAPGGSGTLGTADYRVLIVDLQGANGPGDLFFSINNAAFLPYSKTGNYKSSTSGAVLPTDNNGAISCGVGDKVLAYASQTGWLQSATTEPFVNNSTNAPNRSGDGTVAGGTGTTPVQKIPA